MFWDNYLKKISFLIGVIILSNYFFFTAQAATLEELQNNIQLIKQKISRLEQQSQLYRKTIHQKEQTVSTLQEKIALFKSRIQKLQNDLLLTKEQIKLKELSIQDTQANINKTFLEIEKKKQVIASLIKEIDHYDQKSLLVSILGGEKMSKFLDQTYNLSLIHKNLKQNLDELKQMKSALEVKKQISERQKQSLEELQRRVLIQEYALKQEQAKKQHVLIRTQGEEKKYRALLQQTLAQKTALLREMAQVEKEVVRRKNFLYYSQINKIPPPGTKLFRWPEDHPILTQGYGMTAFAKTGVYGGAGHNGIDMSAGLGSPIRAAADGQILVSGYNRGWGNWVAIKHLNGMVTLYAHMIKPTFLKAGTSVKAGDVIGYEGATGFATGSHLHFSVYYKFFTYMKKGQVYFNYFEGTLNPLNYL